MARTSKKSKVESLINESVPTDSTLLIQLLELLVTVSPDYPGFPSLTLLEQIKNNNYSLTKHERLFLLQALDAVDMLTQKLRLNSIDAVMLDVNRKIALADEFEVNLKEAKESL